MSIDRSLIADMDPFVGLSGHELDVILQDTHSFRVAKEDAIFEQGDDAVSTGAILPNSAV